MTRKERGDLIKEMFVDADDQLKIFDKSLEQEMGEGKHNKLEFLVKAFQNGEDRKPITGKAGP
jgi:hypothetical protein